MKFKKLLSAALVFANLMSVCAFNVHAEIAAEYAQKFITTTTYEATNWVEYINSNFYYNRGQENWNIRDPRTMVFSYDIENTSTITKIEVAVKPSIKSNTANKMQNFTVAGYAVSDLPTTSVTNKQITDSAEVEAYNTYYAGLTELSGYCVETLVNGEESTLDITDAVLSALENKDDLTIKVTETGNNSNPEYVKLVVTRDDYRILTSVNNADACGIEKAINAYNDVLGLNKNAVKTMSAIYDALSDRTYESVDAFKAAFNTAVEEYNTKYIEQYTAEATHKILKIDGNANYYVDRTQNESSNNGTERYVAVYFEIPESVTLENITDINVNFGADMTVTQIAVADWPALSSATNGQYGESHTNYSALNTLWSQFIDIDDVSISTTSTSLADALTTDAGHIFAGKSGDHIAVLLLTGSGSISKDLGYTMTLTCDNAEEIIAEANLIKALNSKVAAELKATVDANADTIGVDKNAVANIEWVYNELAASSAVYKSVAEFKTAFDATVAEYKEKFYITKNYTDTTMALMIPDKGVYVDRPNSENSGTGRNVMFYFDVEDGENIAGANLQLTYENKAVSSTVVGAGYGDAVTTDENKNYESGTPEYTEWFNAKAKLSTVSISGTAADDKKLAYNHDVSDIVTGAGSVAFVLDHSVATIAMHSSHKLIVTYDNYDEVIANEAVIEALNTDDATELKACVEANTDKVAVDTNAVKYIDVIYNALVKNAGTYKTVDSFVTAFNTAVSAYEENNYVTVDVNSVYDVEYIHTNAGLEITDGYAIGVNRLNDSTNETRYMSFIYDIPKTDDLVGAKLTTPVSSYTNLSVSYAGEVSVPEGYCTVGMGETTYFSKKGATADYHIASIPGYNAWKTKTVDVIEAGIDATADTVAFTYDRDNGVASADIANVREGLFAVATSGTATFTTANASVLTLTYDTYVMEPAFVNAVNDAKDADALAKALASNEILLPYDLDAYGDEVKSAVLAELLTYSDFETSAQIKNAYETVVLKNASTYPFAISKVSLVNCAEKDGNDAFLYVGSLVYKKAKSETPESFTAVVAVYGDDNKLLEIQTKPVTVSEDAAVGYEITAPLNFSLETYQPKMVKVFIWDGMETIKPLAEDLTAENVKTTDDVPFWWFVDGTNEKA